MMKSFIKSAHVRIHLDSSYLFKLYTNYYLSSKSTPGLFFVISTGNLFCDRSHVRCKNKSIDLMNLVKTNETSADRLIDEAMKSHPILMDVITNTE
ncbi:unnamed protein product [Rhizophagus irregularis]|nr:unnamed protein product [Rhizophagus irregularis]